MDDKIKPVFVWQKKYCKVCKRKNVPLSIQGLCTTCGLKKVRRVVVQLRSKKGYWYQKWRSRLKRSL